MSASVTVAAGLAAAAGWLAANGLAPVLGRAPRWLGTEVVGRRAARPAVPRAGPAAPQDPAPSLGAPGTPWGAGSPTPGPRGARAAGALAGLAVWLLVGGGAGLVAGLVLAVLAPHGLGRLEPAAVRRERLALLGAAPLVADLLAAALAAGVPLEQSVPVVARAVGGPAEGALLLVHRRTELGEASAAAWRALDQHPGLGPIARSIARSSRTGAPLAGLLSAASGDLRAEATAAARAEVRATSVRAVLPLGLCLLPAFALLGIVPVVGGLLPSL